MPNQHINCWLKWSVSPKRPIHWRQMVNVTCYTWQLINMLQKVFTAVVFASKMIYLIDMGLKVHVCRKTRGLSTVRLQTTLWTSAWWRHQMETFSALLAICAGNSPVTVHWSPVNSPHKGQWRGALMFSFICAWMNGWVNTGEAGDLRRHRAHYDVTNGWLIAQQLTHKQPETHRCIYKHLCGYWFF